MMLVIYGPTATGKTDLAIRLAKKFNGELISADSRQVYRGLDIGSGKLSIEQLNDSTIKRFNGFWIVDDVKIHGFDLVNPADHFTVFDFLKFTNTSIIQLTKENKIPIVVGGTGFYIKSLLVGIPSVGIPADHKLRKKLEKFSSEKLYQKLRKINPKRAISMNESDRANPRRLMRAIEIAIHKRYQVSSIKYQANTEYSIPNTQYLLLGLAAPNDFLYNLADAWLEKRISNGLIEEVKNLIDKGVDTAWFEGLGLEYRWITRYLVEKINLDEARKKLKGDIHSFIRRQKAWFKKLEGIELFDISQKDWYWKLEKRINLCYTQENDRR
ncbi:tRNA (adenosine(37)-N6)-dimethylallyltransferase MiaA [Candidatus Curtissbacteria bacterium]|nr:tRNA (adenosine(37)-N6)-dimethylallyltransferase MiaA [Candidatus Curtissbacteria bacterium]